MPSNDPHGLRLTYMLSTGAAECLSSKLRPCDSLPSEFEGETEGKSEPEVLGVESMLLQATSSVESAKMRMDEVYLCAGVSVKGDTRNLKLS